MWSLIIIISHRAVNRTLMMILYKAAFRTEQQGVLILKRMVKLIKTNFLRRGRFANVIGSAFNEAEGKMCFEHWTYCLEHHKQRG